LRWLKDYLTKRYGPAIGNDLGQLGAHYNAGPGWADVKHCRKETLNYYASVQKYYEDYNKGCSVPST